MSHRYFHIWILLVVMAPFVGCGLHHESADDTQSLPPERKAAVEAGVRSFVSNVAHDVTQYGPAAWSKYFADEPAFFMADEGQLVFPNSQAAKQAIPNLSRVFKSIDLKWGDDLRIDPLTPSLAMVAVPYTEVRVDNAGHRVTETGYFTGLAEYRNGRWQFRDAHWSVVPSASKAP
jgi:hypothetical protein